VKPVTFLLTSSPREAEELAGRLGLDRDTWCWVTGPMILRDKWYPVVVATSCWGRGRPQQQRIDIHRQLARSGADVRHEECPS
jgi:hypothetical protein